MRLGDCAAVARTLGKHILNKVNVFGSYRVVPIL